MSKEVVSDKNAIRMMVMFIFGSSLILPTGGQAGSDIWLSVLIGIVIAFPMLFIYSRILSLYPGQDLFDIVINIFGNFFGKLLCLILTWFAFHLAVLVTRNFGEFIITVSFPETPMIIPMIFLGLLSIWIIKEGIEVLTNLGALFFLLNAPAPTIVFLSLISEMDINNILPIMYNGLTPVLQGSLSAFSFPFAESIIFTMIFFCLKTKNSPYKVFISGTLIGGIPLAGISLAEVLVLGPDLYNATFFPNHSVASRVKIGDFIERLEILVLIAALTGGFIKISVCLLAASNGIAKVFGLKSYKSAVLPLGLLMINFAYFIYDSVMEQIQWAFDIWFYYAFLFQVILPIIILIAAEIKQRYYRQGLGGTNNE